jgi:hypothetical protein
LNSLFSNKGFLNRREYFLEFDLKLGLIFDERGIRSVRDSIIEVTLDNWVSLYFSISSKERGSLNNFSFFLESVSYQVEEPIYLEELCVQLGAISYIEIRLASLSSVSSSRRGLRGIYSNVTYLKVFKVIRSLI